MKEINYLDESKRTSLAKEINFNLELLDMITHFSKTEGDSELATLITNTVYYPKTNREPEPTEQIKKNFVSLAGKINNINYTFPPEIEEGFFPEDEYEKKDSLLKKTFFDSSGREYSLGIICLGRFIIDAYLKIIFSCMEEKSKSKTKKRRWVAKGFSKKLK